MISVRVVSRHIRVPFHAPNHHRGSTRLNSPMLTYRFHEVLLSISVHVYPTHTIKNETCQIRQHVSSHEQCNGGIGRYTWGETFVPCSQQRYTSGSSAPKANINDGPLNSSHAHTCSCLSLEIHGNFTSCCIYISFKYSRLSLMVPHNSILSHNESWILFLNLDTFHQDSKFQRLPLVVDSKANGIRRTVF